MDNSELFEYVEEVARTLTVAPDQSEGDVVFYDYFQPFRRPYSLCEVKDKYQIEAENRGIVPGFLGFENFFWPKRALLDRIRAAKREGLTKEQAKWTLVTARKIRERETTRKLYKEVQVLEEAINYALKKNTEIKKLILKNEQVARDGFEKLCFLKKFRCHHNLT